MKKLIAKAIRFYAGQSFALASLLRITYLRLKYPGLHIDFTTRIERHCKIVCVDGGRLSIKNSFISSGTHLFADSTGNIAITGAFIGRQCVIVSKQNIEIENGSAIAEMVVIRDQNHQIDFDNLAETLYNFDTAGIHIGEHVWIGAKATVLKGASIGSRAVVAASATVTKPIPAGEVWAGVPARYIKKHDYNFNGTKPQPGLSFLQGYQIAS